MLPSLQSLHSHRLLFSSSSHTTLHLPGDCWDWQAVMLSEHCDRTTLTGQCSTFPRHGVIDNVFCLSHAEWHLKMKRARWDMKNEKWEMRNEKLCGKFTRFHLAKTSSLKMSFINYNNQSAGSLWTVNREHWQWAHTWQADTQKRHLSASGFEFWKMPSSSGV